MTIAEGVTQVVPEDADEHLPELRHRTELALAPLSALPGRVSLVRQLVRAIVELTSARSLRAGRRALFGVSPFAGQVPVGGFAFDRQRVGPAALPRLRSRTSTARRSIAGRAARSERSPGIDSGVLCSATSRAVRRPGRRPCGRSAAPRPPRSVRPRRRCRPCPARPAGCRRSARVSRGRGGARRGRGWARCASTSTGFPSAAREAIVVVELDGADLGGFRAYSSVGRAADF